MGGMAKGQLFVLVGSMALFMGVELGFKAILMRFPLRDVI
jgi:hypothetical protein